MPRVTTWLIVLGAAPAFAGAFAPPPPVPVVVLAPGDVTDPACVKNTALPPKNSLTVLDVISISKGTVPRPTLPPVVCPIGAASMS